VINSGRDLVFSHVDGRVGRNNSRWGIVLREQSLVVGTLLYFSAGKLGSLVAMGQNQRLAQTNRHLFEPHNIIKLRSTRYQPYAYGMSNNFDFSYSTVYPSHMQAITPFGESPGSTQTINIHKKNEIPFHTPRYAVGMKRQ